VQDNVLADGVSHRTVTRTLRLAGHHFDGLCRLGNY